LPLNLGAQLLEPIKAMRLRYLPLLMVYFAYGALGVVDISRDLWVKESLSLSPAELAGVAVWFTLPWTIKVVFGELVDTVPILGSRRKVYIFIGATLTASGLLCLAGAAGGWLRQLRPDQFYVLGMMLIVLGTVVQDVVADATSTEVVERVDADGRSRPDAEIRAELGMVQVLGRLALSFGILSVAGLSGLLSEYFSREAVFLMALVVPAISITGSLFIRTEPSESRPIDVRLLGGGFLLGAFVLIVGLADLPFAQEVVFLFSMAVVITMLVIVTRELDAAGRRAILYTAIIIFAFRATPAVGDGYFWWTLDVLKFDGAFYGILRQTAGVIGLLSLWLLAKPLTQYSVTKTLMWLTVAGFVLSAPTIALYYGLHHWTEANFGFGARWIAVIDAAATSPFAQLSMIPLLTLIAYYAPAGHRATWFALMASLMNLALVAGQLGTKYLNLVFPVQRGDYELLGILMIVAAVLAFLIPLMAIMRFGRKV
jgi:BT1 family